MPAPRLAFSLCGLATIAFLSAVRAQSVTAPVQPQYQDRYIGGGSLAPDITTGDDATSDTQGLARSLQIDGVASVLSSHDSGSSHSIMEDGIIAKAQWETATYGA